MVLTAKRERYAQLLASTTLSQSDAYRQSFDVSPDTLPESVHQLASHLAADVNVASRVRELKAAAQAKMATAQAWNLDRLVAELETQLEIARSGGAKTVSAGNGALELIGRVTGILSDKAREAPMAPITRVVVVLDHGVAAGKERFTEAEGYKVLPQSKDETESEHVPPAGITKSVEEEI